MLKSLLIANRAAAPILLSTALLAACSNASAQAPSLESKAIKVGNLNRSYAIYVAPACKLPRAQCPLVLGFHGGGMRGVSGKQLADSGNFVATAQRRNVIMLFPDAVDRNWNDGRPGIGGGVDDIGFVRAMIAQVKKDVPGFDASRIYSTGMSNGGHMSFRLACEMPGVIKAIAPVAATISVQLSQNCTPAAPVSMLNILGEQDPISPYAGGEIKGGRGLVSSAAQTLEFWQKANRCLGAVNIIQTGTMTRRRFAQCAGGVQVWQISMSDGGHTWPGYPGSRLLARLVGPTSMAMDTTNTIFDFFGIAERRMAR